MIHLKRITLCPRQYPTTERYPFNLSLFHRTKIIQFSSPVSFFVGENGSGKSTLLRAIAQKCGIHIWKRDETVRLQANSYEDDLYKYIQTEWTDGPVSGSFFGSDIFRDFSHFLDEWAVNDPGILDYFGGRSLITLSHGQSLMSLFRARYRIKGLYFLDEPETALSPKSQLELLDIFQEMSRAGHAQFIVATHTPILMSCSGAQILSFDQVPVKDIHYEDTDHYKVYKRFFDSEGGD
jgi:predicted ATPase